MPGRRATRTVLTHCNTISRFLIAQVDLVCGRYPLSEFDFELALLQNGHFKIKLVSWTHRGWGA